MKRETKLTPSEVVSRSGMAALPSVLLHRRHIGPRWRTRGWKTLGLLLLVWTHASCTVAGTTSADSGRAAVAPPMPAAQPSPEAQASPAPQPAPAARPSSAAQPAPATHPSPAAPAPLAAEIDAILDAAPYDQVHFGILAVDAASGRVLYERNARKKFVPASNEKLLVTSAGMCLLGPEYRYRTALWSTGTPEDGVLVGNLVLVGTGDPTLSRTFWPSGEDALAALADSVRSAGIERVTGDLVVDVSAWDSTSIGPNWEAEDLGHAYGATGGAFAIDDGELHLRARGSRSPGEPATVTWSPAVTDGFVVSRLVTAQADSATRIRGAYLPESRRLVLEGEVRPRGVDTTSIAVRDPVRQASAALYRALAGAGVQVDGGWSVAWDSGGAVGHGCAAGLVASCPAATEVAALTSPPLTDIVAAILKPSQNWMAEQLLRTLGAIYGEKGSWPEGIKVVRRFLEDSVGVDSLDISPRDGSGLSSADLVTPRALVRILQYLETRPEGVGFREALAEPSKKGSTLEERLPELEGSLFAKTGTISNVNSLSGYLVRDDGREVVFSILSNGSGLPSARVREVIDDVVRTLAGLRP